jgi:nicotinamide mononucleotide (NMN) deamidase PncC
MNDIVALIEEIHATPHKSVLTVTGAGSQAVAWLLGVAGASRTVLEALVPYGRGSMIALLGTEPEQYVSSQTARDMARAAYRRGLQLVEDDSPVVGVAGTATIATDRTKRGDHRCFIATWDQDRSLQYDLVLEKGARDRAGEEELVSRLLLLALARSFCIESGLELGLTGKECLRDDNRAHPPPIQRLISGDVSFLTVSPDGSMIPEVPFDTNIPGVIFPGSFNPLHSGHETLARVVSQELNAEVAFEISVTNVDKPPLEEAEIRRRMGQFRGNWKVLLTRAETFYQKARLFPGSTFVLGSDTALRLVDPRYYGGSEADMLAALAEMWAWGSRFLVAGRQHRGKFMGLADVPVPQGFYPIFQAIPESRFRVDLSSTELRAGS